jgi:ribosomal protein S18 acetylase RimI-like enzyme
MPGKTTSKKAYMASGVSIEILDLRHFAAPMLRPVLEAEGELWEQRLHWDYHSSARLLMQYLDSHMLPGYAATEGGHVAGYTFCVYEETKAVIGDVFALRGPQPGSRDLSGLVSRPESGPAHEVETTLLHHLFELLLNSPQVDRVESQLLIHPAGSHAGAFREAGFDVYRRLFLVQSLKSVRPAPAVELPAELELRPWRDEDMNSAGRLISVAYRNHPDAVINDQYLSLNGSQRFLHNIVRYSGCGVFCPQASQVLVDRQSRELAAMVLGSRVSPQSGHITQVCVHPKYRRRGLAKLLLSAVSSAYMRMSVSEISLTVTEGNSGAVDLYLAEGYTCEHTFDAAVWNRQRKV